MAAADYASKAAEATVLRNRLQQVERDNVRLQNELVHAKDQSTQNEKVKQLQGEVQKLQHELRYANQDLLTSEGERKRLKSSLASAQSELDRSMKRRTEEAHTSQSGATAPGAALQIPAEGQTALATSATTAAADEPQHGIGSGIFPQSTVVGAGKMPYTAASAATQAVEANLPMANSTFFSPVVAFAQPAAARREPRDSLLQQAMAQWETASQSARGVGGSSTPCAPSWCALREAVLRWKSDSTTPISTIVQEVAVHSAQQLHHNLAVHAWTAAGYGARFVSVWVALHPEVVPELLKAGDGARDMLESLAAVLHAAVLDADVEVDMRKVSAAARRSCTLHVMEAFVEVTGKLGTAEVGVLAVLFRRPSMCALLTLPPCVDDCELQILCLRLLQSLLRSTSSNGSNLFGVAHQADSQENVLLAASNLLLPPAASNPQAADAAEDGPHLQQCRVVALELFSHCLAAAPRPEMVLQLRCAATVEDRPVDTVLQRIVLLCHHELLALQLHGFDGGPWRSQELRQCAARRLTCASLSLACLSNFVWQVLPPLPPEDKGKEEFHSACAHAVLAFGRTAPLLAAIAASVGQLANDWPAQTQKLLGSVSALRVLLPHLGGDVAKSQGSAAESEGGRDHPVAMIQG
mmetsp:Transcript_58087/g.138180  ORF Transcript_58087/g.138180 Transcript_58087/m.138180 type:complete len:638 (-) Transcript_58087:48-1961(-)